MNESGVWEIHFSWWTGWRLMVAGRVDGRQFDLFGDCRRDRSHRPGPVRQHGASRGAMDCFIVVPLGNSRSDLSQTQNNL
jgi:hypothetical protein